VLSLYAAFERIIKEALCKPRLGFIDTNGDPPYWDSELAQKALKWIEDDLRMDEAVLVFGAKLDQDIVSQVGTVRAFRHWIAHGRSQARKPPFVPPKDTYEILSEFLKRTGLW
ncbi:MAG: hypothetical protein NTX50_23365, partial [Candidatus Sumerlaeota bacterium]|nr:hypothetical protein [Candidatus Sumerlaeota bacterium]